MPWSPTEPDEVPSLGAQVGEWIEAHCRIPDGPRAGAPYLLTEEMWGFLLHHYRLRPDAVEGQRAPAFVYRRSQLVRPQKWGKGPFSAALICAEAVGPVLFAGWDAAGQPVGMPWPTPLIQVTANSEDQTQNVYAALRPMIELGPLADVIPDTGETRINLPGGGRIDPVTSRARSRLGQRVTFVVQDETGMWTAPSGMLAVAETQRRGLAGMGGRSVETTNAWDPSDDSVAQRTAESRAADVYRDHRLAPITLSYGDRRERRRIHRIVYGDSSTATNRGGWVDLDAIEAEAAELSERDPRQAERFFGNRIVHGLGAWLPDGLWESTLRPVDVPDGTPVALGFDGSDSDDWTAIRACTLGGHRFTPTYGPDARPTIWNPAEWGGSIPRAEVDAAVDELHDRFAVVLAYADPPDWRSEIGEWSARHGEKVWVEWPTYRPVPMHAALDRAVADLSSHRASHDGCPITAAHVANARRRAAAGQRYVLGKPTNHQKIDAAMADVLANEAAAVAREAGLGRPRQRRGMVVL